MTFSGTRFGGWFFLLQALAIVAWWLSLYVIPSSVSAFIPADARLAIVKPLARPRRLNATNSSAATTGVGTPLPFIATNRLVTAGPYSYVRNPMVVAGLGQGLAVALWFGSWAVFAYVVIGGMIWQCLVRPAEERDLRDAFGDEFATYCEHVRCWIPRRDAFRRRDT